MIMRFLFINRLARRAIVADQGLPGGKILGHELEVDLRLLMAL